MFGGTNMADALASLTSPCFRAICSAVWTRWSGCRSWLLPEFLGWSELDAHPSLLRMRKSHRFREREMQGFPWCPIRIGKQAKEAGLPAARWQVSRGSCWARGIPCGWFYPWSCSRDPCCLKSIMTVWL